MLIPPLEQILESDFRLVLPRSMGFLRVARIKDSSYIIGPAGPGYISYEHHPELQSQFSAADVQHQVGQFTSFVLSGGEELLRIYLHHRKETMPQRMQYSKVSVDEYIRREAAAIPAPDDAEMRRRMLMLSRAATNIVQ